MHRTADTDTGSRWELRARVASGAFLAAALAGLFLPWDRIVRSETQTGLEAVPLGLTTVLAFALSVRRTRRAAVARAILAVISTGPLVFAICFSFAWTGRPPDIVAGWLTFWALVGAIVANVIAARVPHRPIAKVRDERPNRLRVRRSDVR